MTIRTILEYPDPRLNLPSQPVTRFDADLNSLVDDLLETLYSTSAIALSAPQIDDRSAVLVIDLSEDRSTPKVYINPQILAKSTWGFVEESCLSVPDIVGNVIRATEVRAQWQDREGRVIEDDLSGMDAVCLQHEMDHLAGKLFIDRLSIFRRLSIRARQAARSRSLRKSA